MKSPESDFDKMVVYSQGVRNFFGMPSDMRNAIIENCIQRAVQDEAYFASVGATIEDFEDGTVLPSGNTVISDEQGRKLRRAPKEFDPPRLFSSN